jgi:hypothetical protein
VETALFLHLRYEAFQGLGGPQVVRRRPRLSIRQGGAKKACSLKRPSVFC